LPPIFSELAFSDLFIIVAKAHALLFQDCRKL
jgi:hypothetical protein